MFQEAELCKFSVPMGAWQVGPPLNMPSVTRAPCWSCWMESDVVRHGHFRGLK